MKDWNKFTCPNCHSINTVYSIPDWENGKLIDPGFFECMDCGFNTGTKNTEKELLASLAPESVTPVSPGRYRMSVEVDMYECDGRLWPGLSVCFGHYDAKTLIEEGVTFVPIDKEAK